VGHLLISRDRWQRRPAPAASADVAASRRWSRRWALWLALGYLGQVALRVWLSRSQTVPMANPDESAYLMIARVLAHAGAVSDFSYGTLYQAGYPLILVPIYWFTSNSVTVYHATMVINAVVNAALMPLAYLVFRRLSVRRWIAFAAAAVAAVVPEGVFYTQYALSDAIFPVVVLAWLLCVHSWLTAESRRGALGAAVGSALLAGYAYAVHPRGLVVVVGFALVALYAAVRRIVPAVTLAAAAVTLAAVVAVTSRVNHHISDLLYPEGPRSLTGQAVSRLTDVKDQIYVLEMAGGQLWRLTLDTWGIAALGLIAAAVTVFRRGVRRDLRIMAALTVLITLAIVYIAPAALPDGQEPNWASGRYPDAMSVTFFIVGVVVLLRVRGWRLVGYAAAAAALGAGTAVVVVHYAGARQHVTGFGAFNWADPVVLTQGWDYLSVPMATVVGLSLLAFWVLAALALRWLSGRSFARWRVALLVPIAAMNLFALVQMTTHISRASIPAQEANSLALVTVAGLKPGDRVALDNGLSTDWPSWVPQSYEVWWTELNFFYSESAPVPAGTTVVEVPWPAGKPASASWSKAPAGWRVVAQDRVDNWVAWRAPSGH
jgi:hypothetical protein